MQRCVVTGLTPGENPDTVAMRAAVLSPHKAVSRHTHAETNEPSNYRMDPASQGKTRFQWRMTQGFRRSKISLFQDLISRKASQFFSKKHFPFKKTMKPEPL